MRVGIVQGLSVLAFVMAVYVDLIAGPKPRRTEAQPHVHDSGLANIGLIMANRSWSGDLALVQGPILPFGG